MSLLDFKCQVCGASIEASPSDEEVFCQTCGSEYQVIVHKEVSRPSPSQTVCYPLRLLNGARQRLGTFLGHPMFDPQYDVNRDNMIDEKDLELISRMTCALAVYVRDLWSGRPVEGATVEIDTVASAVTDASGMAGFPRAEEPTEGMPFAPTPLVPGTKYTMKVSAPGYKTARTRLTFREYGDVRVALHRSRGSSHLKR